MRDSFPFLIRLGLRPDADAKDIRRAYARELKKIDQSADPAGFQDLREAYEVALQWHAHQQFTAAQEAAHETGAAPEPAAEPPALPESAPAPAAPEPEPEHDDPYFLADQAFQKFGASIAMLVQRNDARHQSLWRTVLQRSLDDDRLLNLTARTIFEARLAHLLASGWQPGHETLFVVASEVFEWVRDSRRILQFGEAGAMVNRAIDEWKLYESLSPHAIGTFKQVIQYVRATPKPEGVAGRNDLMLFHQLAGRFYTWLAIIIDREVLEDWCNAANAEAQRPGPAPAQQLMSPMEPHVEPEQPKESPWTRPGNVLPMLFLLIALIRGCMSMVEDKPKGFYPPAEDRRTHAQVAQDKDPQKERIEEIRSRIKYKWPANTASGEYAAEFEVFIDAEGAVLGMNKLRSSGNQDYDAAVEKAIRETKPFPVGTRTRFTLRYGVTFNKPAPPKGKPATNEQLRVVQAQIFYVPGADVEPGQLKVKYELELNDDGKVIKLRKLKASRDLAYDEVVAEALKETNAFPHDTERKFTVEYSRTIGPR